ncbi:MAG: glycoside hydrolase family 32 protein [Propionibacteriaceae bacterium]|nr:glycoside hydrolase family 32 protein [Micropruina sp.]
MNEDLFAAAENAIAGSLATQDPDYPLFHVAPPVGRLNDPNGLVLRDGRYHAFYQFSPFHPHRKLVYWGHASSDDLTHWRDDGPAIVPDSRYDADGAYSGSAVLDGPDVRFYYTGNLRHPDGGRDTSQCLVTSTDLERFDKHPGNPLIPVPPPGYTAHVRDPQVWRDADGSYRMCLGAQRANETGCALLYRSNDGIQWWFEGELSFPDAQGAFDAFGYMWECPSLIRVPDEASGEWRDVLVFCPQGIAPLGEGFENIFPCGSVIGRLVGTELRDTGPFVELDRGFEFYAPQVVARQDADREPPLLLAWLGNAGEDDQPSLAHGWVHTLSVPRELTVRDGRLVQRPRLECPARTSMQINGRQLRNQRVELVEARGVRSFALGLCLDVTEAQSWSLRLGAEDCHIDLAVAQGRLVVDRSTTRYPHGGRRTVTLPETPTIELDLYFDRSVLEVFFGRGALAFSLRAYLSEAPFVVQLTATGALGVMSATISPFE